MLGAFLIGGASERQIGGGWWDECEVSTYLKMGGLICSVQHERQSTRVEWGSEMSFMSFVLRYRLLCFLLVVRCYSD